jgi:hypothetical protein
MNRRQLLALKTILTVYEAAKLLPRGNGDRKAAVSFIVDAINADELAAAIKRWPRHNASPGAHLSDGDINQMETTVQRSDLDAWLKTKGMAVDVPVVANLEIAPMSKADEQVTTTGVVQTYAYEMMNNNTFAYRQSVWAAALGQVERDGIKYRAGNHESTAHRRTDARTRTHILAAVIASAQKYAVNASEYQSVWAALVKLAESSNPPPPLLGHVESVGIKYQAEYRVRFFTKQTLRLMMNRAASQLAR